MKFRLIIFLLICNFIPLICHAEDTKRESTAGKFFRTINSMGLYSAILFLKSLPPYPVVNSTLCLMQKAADLIYPEHIAEPEPPYADHMDLEEALKAANTIKSLNEKLQKLQQSEEL